MKDPERANQNRAYQRLQTAEHRANIHSSKGIGANKLLMSVVKNVYNEFYFCKIISSKYRTAVLVKTWLSSN